LRQEEGGLRRIVEGMVTTLFGDAARVALMDVTGKSWAGDNLTFGMAGARGRAYGHPLLRRPLDWGVHFAGTETEQRNGHIEGAVIAGKRAAAEIQSALRRESISPA
jgi:monoamine oxidase